jgi:hypothetical protein
VPARVLDEIALEQSRFLARQRESDDLEIKFAAQEAAFFTRRNIHESRMKKLRDPGIDRLQAIREMDEEEGEFELRQQEAEANRRANSCELAEFNVDKCSHERTMRILNVRLSGLEALINNWNGGISQAPTYPRQDLDDDLRTTRERVRAVLADSGGPMRMSAVVKQVHAQGSIAREDTIRATLQKMRESGQVRRVDRGLYELVGTTDVR